MLKKIVLIMVIQCLAGCAALSIEDVAAWDKKQLNKPGMSYDASSLSTSLENHIYSSKEATTGNVYGKGGCGCE